MKSVRHFAKEGCLKHTSMLSSLLQSNSSGYKGNVLSVIQPETWFVQFLIEHNIPISTADHAGELFWKTFHQNPLAKQYACGCTKATAIVKECACDHTTNLADAMRNGHFVLGTDGSQEGGEKFFWCEVWQYILCFIKSCWKSKDRTGKIVFLFVDEHFKWKRSLKFSKWNKKQFAYIGKFLFLFVKFSVKNTIRSKKYYQNKNSTIKQNRGLAPLRMELMRQSSKLPLTQRQWWHSGLVA